MHLALQNLLNSILVLILERREDRSVSAYRQRSVNRGAFRLSESSSGEIAMNEGNRHRTFAHRRGKPLHRAVAHVPRGE